MLEVINAEYLHDYKILCRFNIGIEKIIDFQPELNGEIYVPLQDIEYFKKFSIILNTIAWQNGADFAPEYLFEIGKNALLVLTRVKQS